MRRSGDFSTHLPKEEVHQN